MFTLGALAVAVVMACLGYAQGWRGYTVSSPSMGTAAPVGSLVITAPRPVDAVKKGDIVAYERDGRSYTHRVIATSNAGVRTHGDINAAPDPLTVTHNQFQGLVVFKARVLGWVIIALPYLVVGWLIGWLLVRGVTPVHWRRRANFLQAIIVVNIALWIVRPFLGAQMMSSQSIEGGSQARIVGTGLMPVKVVGNGGTDITLHSGEVGSVVARHADSQGRYLFTPSMDLPWTWWLVAVAVCLIPMAYALLIGFREEPKDEQHHKRGPNWPGRLTVAAVVAGVAALGLVLPHSILPSKAAFTAGTANVTNSFGTRQVSNCLEAMRAHNDTGSNVHGRLFLGYALGGGTGVAGDADQGQIGPFSLRTYNITGTSNVGCVTDQRKRQQQAVDFNGVDAGVDASLAAGMSAVRSDPRWSNNMSQQVWFRTDTTTGGVLACMVSANYKCSDRALYLTDAGNVIWQVYRSGLKSPKTYNDNQWHMAVGQVSPSGSRLWIDGELVAFSAQLTAGYNGVVYPQWGYHYGSSYPAYWPEAPTSLYYRGSMQMVAVYGGNTSGAQLSDAEVKLLYQSGLA